jgi:hypothetical protein
MPDPVIDAAPPDDQILIRIGTVATEWSWVESLTAEFLAHLLQADPGAMYVITQSAANSAITNWVKTLIEIRFKDHDATGILLNLFKEIEDARLERNTIIHGLWHADPQPGFAHVGTFRWTREEVARDEMWSTHDLDDFIEHVRLLQRQLGNLGLRLGFLKPPT